MEECRVKLRWGMRFMHLQAMMPQSCLCLGKAARRSAWSTGNMSMGLWRDTCPQQACAFGNSYSLRPIHAMCRFGATADAILHVSPKPTSATGSRWFWST